MLGFTTAVQLVVAGSHTFIQNSLLRGDSTGKIRMLAFRSLWSKLHEKNGSDNVHMCAVNTGKQVSRASNTASRRHTV